MNEDRRITCDRVGDLYPVLFTRLDNISAVLSVAAADGTDKIGRRFGGAGDNNPVGLTAMTALSPIVIFTGELLLSNQSTSYSFL